MIFYYPNRPTLIPADPINPMHPKPDYLNELEASGRFLAEQKFNGDNCYLFTDTMEFWNRHREQHRYTPPPEVMDELQRLPKGSCINLELMHYKTKTVKDTLMVHCIMIHKNKPLVGKTWGEARKILEDFQYGDHVKLSRVWESGFSDLYQQADGPIIEGLVLKDPKGKLVFSTTPIKDVNWMKKVRVSCKKYPF